MGSPTVFTGSRTKFISSKGALLKDGSVIDNDGVPNFIKNGHAEINTTGWATYADAAQSTPVDGTGGTANITWTRVTTTPLAGAGSFAFTKDTSNRLGQGVSYEFTVEPAYRARVCNIQFDYIFTASNGTFDTSNSNLTVYIYDVTNSQLIQPSTYTFSSNSQSIPTQFQSSFQTSATGSTYRLIFHVATAATVGYTIKFDNVQVTPTEYAYGTPVTDWQSYTPTVSNLGTGSSTNTGRWRRIGDSAQIEFNIQKDASAGSGTGTVTISLPSGLVVDTSKFSASSFNGHVGTLYTNDSTQAASNNAVQYVNSVSGIVLLYGTISLQGLNMSANNTWRGVITLPILGWSSSVQVSDGYNSRALIATAGRSASQTVSTNAETKIDINAYDVDTATMVDLTNKRINILSSGWYSLSANIVAGSVTSSETVIGRIKLSGTTINANVGITSTNGFCYIPISAKSVYCTAGQYVEFFVDSDLDTSYTVGGSTATTWLCVEKSQAPTTIAANDTVAMSYQNTAGTSLTNGATIPFATKVFDTHGAWINNNTFKVPISGIYKFQIQNYYASASFAATTKSTVLKINGSTSRYLGLSQPSAAYTGILGITGSVSLQLNAGDEVTFTSGHNEGTARNLDTTSGTNFICIERVGN